jgi:hypothetical protein
MSNKAMVQAFGVVAGITGFCLIGMESSWWIAIGVLVMLTGNNAERRALAMKD